MEKIKMPVPIAELDGDEMTHVLWGMIKDTLIKPFVDLNTEYYDLSLPHREETADAVTAQAAEAIKRLKIGVKCATITPNLQRQEEYGLTQLWKSPNATIRAALDGTVFRAPILLKRVKPVVTCWEKPVTIARHAYGDLYKAVEYLHSLLRPLLLHLRPVRRAGCVVRRQGHHLQGLRPDLQAAVPAGL